MAKSIIAVPARLESKRLPNKLTKTIKGKTVIIIDDIIDTGNTLNFIKKYIQILL